MRHTCKDGISAKLIRTGPVGSQGPDVYFRCPRCGWGRTADVLARDARIVADAIIAASRHLGHD